MTSNIRAELLLLRKRAATWILLGIWTALAATFAYIVPYMIARDAAGPRAAEQLAQLLPDRFAGNISAGFPFYGGTFALMLGVLSAGSEFGWGTLKTLFTQRPGRLRIFGAKLAALALALVPFVVVVFTVGAAASAVVASIEGAALAWPSPGTVARGLLACWLILLVWAAFGVLLAVLSRGTALAIGVGILYTLVIEGLLSLLAGTVDVLEPLVKLFVRANAYSLLEPLGATAAGTTDDGPGAFSGPFVGSTQALLVLAAYLVACLGISAFLLQRRDVT